MITWPRQSWLEAEPSRLEREWSAIAAVAPDFIWLEGGGWEGLAPVWPFSRPRPAGLEGFLAGRRFRLRVVYSQAFPMIAPTVWPLDPQPDPRYRTQHAWHVNPNGSLCLLQAASDWTGADTAADLVVKAAGWFLEYQLMEASTIASMTEHGIAGDASLDHLLAPPDDKSVGEQ